MNIPALEVVRSCVAGQIDRATELGAFCDSKAVGHGLGRRGCRGWSLNGLSHGGGFGHGRSGLDGRRFRCGLSRRCASVSESDGHQVLGVVTGGCVHYPQAQGVVAVSILSRIQRYADITLIRAAGDPRLGAVVAAGEQVQVPSLEVVTCRVAGDVGRAAQDCPFRNRQPVGHGLGRRGRRGWSLNGLSHGGGFGHGRSGLDGRRFRCGLSRRCASVSESDGHQVLGVVTGGCVHYPQAQGVVAVSILSRIQRYADITLIRAAGDPRLGAVVAAGEQVQVPSLEVVTCRVAGDVGRAAQDCPFRDRQPVFHLRACSHRHGQERSQDGHYEYHPKQFCAEHLILPPCVWSE